MTDPLDDHDPRLGERMERAVGGLQAPDVTAVALARGRRQRTHRRLAYAAGGLAAATALALTVPALAAGLTGPEQDRSAPPVASDPATTSPSTTPTAAAPDTEDECGAAATGWWSKSTAEVEAELSALLPDGVTPGVTDDRWRGAWGGNLVTADDTDFARLTLLAPPGTPGGLLTLEEARDGGPCAVGSHAPEQPVAPCAELTGLVACEEIRSGDGRLVGVVTEQVEQTIVEGQEQATYRGYRTATVAVPGGGHVELYVAEGTRADTPDTVHDPADVPALTSAQLRAIVTDPAWTR